MTQATVWENLTIRNNYLFLKVMRNERICKKMIEKILNITIEKITYPEEEKEIDIRLDSKSIRLDVYVRDEKGTVFNIEMQATDSQENLQKRTRYYQGLIDIDLIDKGAAYDELNPTYIIFICTFDPFGSNRNMYTFRNVCIEDSTLELNDEATKIFLNSKGDSGDVSPDIKAFLQYVEGVLTENTFVQEINSEVAHVKNNKEWRREFMTFEMELKRMEQKGIKQGIEQGTVEKARCMALKMLQDNCPVEMIAKYTELSEDEIKRLAEALV